MQNGRFSYSVNVVICSSRLVHRCSSSCNRLVIAESLSATGCVCCPTELTELVIDSAVFDGRGWGVAEEKEEDEEGEGDVVVVVDATLSFSILIDMFEYVFADNTGLYSFIFVGDSGSMHSVSIGVALYSLCWCGSVKCMIRWYDESLQIAWMLSIRCFSFSSCLRHASESEMVGDFMELLLWLDTVSSSSSSNEMTCFRRGAINLDDSLGDFVSPPAPITGTAIIISFGFCKHFVSTEVTIFSSGLSTVTANRIDPKPIGMHRIFFKSN